MTKIVLIGEAPGEHEDQLGVPFIGPAGQELYRILCEAHFPLEPLRNNYVAPISMTQVWARSNLTLLNVFNARPEANNIELFYGTKRDPVEVELPGRRFGSSTKWVLTERAADVRRLHDALLDLRPNLTVALGATATWALGLGASIGKLRGFVHQTPWGKVLPTYHPAAVLRSWSLRVPTLFDLYKARREMEFAGTRLVERTIWTEPSIEDLYTWWDAHGQHSKLLALDIETLKAQQITEVGFASDSTHALHIPFCIEERHGNTRTYRSWWPDARSEAAAWKFVKMVCESSIPKIGQNGAQYDLFWLAKEMGIVVKNYRDDTMQMAHALWPEMGKSLYDLGAIWLDEASWKSIRKDAGKDNE